MITSIKNEKGTHVSFGDHRVAIFTLETSDSAIAKFIALAKARESELTALGNEFKKKVDWNHANRGKGQSWPVFTKVEKIVSQLCKEAGIIDS